MLVVENKLVELKYFLDEMQMYEVLAIIPIVKYCDRNYWEMSRLQISTLINMFAREPKKPSEILHLPWDDEVNDEEKNTEISNADIERLRKKADKIKEKWQKTTV